MDAPADSLAHCLTDLLSKPFASKEVLQGRTPKFI